MIKKKEESSYLNYWDVNNLYRWEIQQKLSVKNFPWIEEICQFDEYFQKIYNADSNIGYFI